MMEAESTLLRNDENIRVELQEVGHAMRFYLDDRFRIFTLATAINAGELLYLQYSTQEMLTKIFPLSMAFLSLICIIFDRSSRNYYEKYLRQAIKIQDLLGVEIYSIDKRPPFIDLCHG